MDNYKEWVPYISDYDGVMFLGDTPGFAKLNLREKLFERNDIDGRIAYSVLNSSYSELICIQVNDLKAGIYNRNESVLIPKVSVWYGLKEPGENGGVTITYDVSSANGFVYDSIALEVLHTMSYYGVSGRLSQLDIELSGWEYYSEGEDDDDE